MLRNDDTELLIRPGRAEDLSGIDELYNGYIESSAITFDVTPITPQERARWFERFDDRGPYRLLVAYERGSLRGFACSRELRPKAAYATSVETTVYLHRGAQGRGLGDRLYRELFTALEGEDLHRAFAAITLPNLASVALHLKHGFRSIGVWEEVGRKFDRYWSVAWYARDLDRSRPTKAL